MYRSKEKTFHSKVMKLDFGLCCFVPVKLHHHRGSLEKADSKPLILGKGEV